MDLPFDDMAVRDWQTIDSGGPVRVAMVGVGWWTREQAIPAVVDATFCETTVLVSGSKEKARRATDLAPTIEHGITYDEFHDGVAADAYDAVYICTPNATHLDHVEAAARLGKPVLCEKPMEATVERSRAIVDAARDNDVTVMVAYRMQTEPTVRRAREVIESGLVGDPVQVHSHMTQRLLEINPDTDQWRLDPDLSGGATVMDLGVYPINTTRFLLGSDPVAVSARETRDHEAFAAVGDEHVSFTLAFPDGVHAACSASQNAHLSSQLRVIGTRGEVVLEPVYFPLEDRGFRLSVGGETHEISFEQVDQMTEEFDYFAHCLLTDTDPAPDAAHGLVDVQVADAIYEAAETGETVEV